MKKKAQLRGMTLMEIVVSMALYAVIAFLIAQIMTTVNATMRATHQLNERLSAEVKYADNRMVTGGGDVTLTPNPASVTISYGTSSQTVTPSVYTAVYDDGNPSMVNANYRYVVYTEHTSAGVDWTLPYTMTVRIPSATYNWIDVAKASVENVVAGSSGSASITLTGSDGTFDIYEIVVPRIDESVGTGVGRANVTFFRDISSQTGGVSTPIYQTYAADEFDASGNKIHSAGDFVEDAAGNKILLGNSDNFPFMNLTLDYCQWFANTAVPPEVLPNNFFTKVTFTVNADGTVTAGRSER